MSDKPESPAFPPEDLDTEPATAATEVEDSPFAEPDQLATDSEPRDSAAAETGTSEIQHDEDGLIIGAVPVAIFEQVPEAEPAKPVFAFTLGHAIWIAAGVLFAALRLGSIWQAPIGGAELLHLAGSWQASIGVEDSRYAPTLFQFFSSVFLRMSDSEIPVRVLAYAGSLTIPLALYRVRAVVGQPAALLALVVLALEPATISLGANGSAMGFDLVIATWVFALVIQRSPVPAGLPGILAFLCATSGPIVLPLVLALLIITAVRRSKPEPPLLIELAAGVVFGILVTSVAYGTGPITFRIAPIDLLFDSFDQDWTTMTTAQFIAAYAGALLLGTIAAAIYFGRRFRGAGRLEDWEVLLLTWVGVAAGWALAASQSNSAAAAAGFALPAVLLVSIVIARAIPAMLAANWWLARFLLPAAGAAALIAMNYTIDWARLDRVSNAGEVALVVILGAGALLALGVLAWDRASRPTLLAPALVVGMLAAIPGSFGIALSAIDEPVPSPRSTVQARQIRDIALEAIAERPGAISVHPQLAQTVTWPFRDSGAIEIASSPSPGATIVIWPAGLQAPEGYAPLTGTWAFEETVTPPTRDALRYLRWVTNRNTLVITPETVTVYLRASGEGE